MINILFFPRSVQSFGNIIKRDQKIRNISNILITGEICDVLPKSRDGIDAKSYDDCNMKQRYS